MGYQKEREEFFYLFARHFPQASISVARALLREASASQRYNEISSSIDVGQAELDRLTRRDDARDDRVRVICERIGATLETKGDPRGNPYALTGPSGYCMSVPGRSLPDRCFR